MAQAKQTFSYLKYSDGKWKDIDSPVIREWPLSITLNGKEFVTLLCTPTKLNALVVGFLFLEGIVDSLDQVALIRVCPDETRCEVLVKEPRMDSELRRVITSGCSGGTSFQTRVNLPPICSEARFSPIEIINMMRSLLTSAQAYKETGGVHTSALADGERLFVSAEDVGRHNTIDKIAGECLIGAIPTRGHMLLTTGRISSEMLVKASRMKIPVVVSRTSPTDLAVKLAQELQITVVGYVRGGTMNVYSAPERIQQHELVKVYV